MTDYYDELGVAKDVSPEELRKAFRRKARKHHPDRGGSDALMAKINRAYEVLSSPQRRLTYDQTGQDQFASHLETCARDTVINKFTEWLGNDNAQGDMLFAVQMSLSQDIAKQQQQISQGTWQIEKLRKRMKRLKFKGKGPNLICQALDHKLASVDQQIEICRQNIATLTRAGEMVKEFEFEPDESYSSMVRGFENYITKTTTKGY